jgi:hypothetical protein
MTATKSSSHRHHYSNLQNNHTQSTMLSYESVPISWDLGRYKVGHDQHSSKARGPKYNLACLVRHPLRKLKRIWEICGGWRCSPNEKEAPLSPEHWLLARRPCTNIWWQEEGQALEGARAGYGKACEQVVRGGGAGVVGRPREEDGCGGGLTCELDSWARGNGRVRGVGGGDCGGGGRRLRRRHLLRVGDVGVRVGIAGWRSEILRVADVWGLRVGVLRKWASWAMSKAMRFSDY